MKTYRQLVRERQATQPKFAEHQNADQAAARRIRNSAQWAKCRRIAMRNSPLCSDPHGTHAKLGITVAAEMVHHRVPVEVDPSKAFDMSNLEPMCYACHKLLHNQAAKQGKQRDT